MNAYFPVPFTILNMEFSVRVLPGSSRNAVLGPAQDGTMTVQTTVRHGTNAVLCGLLARYYNVPRSAVSVRDSRTSRVKLVRIASRLTDILSKRSESGSLETHELTVQ